MSYKRIVREETIADGKAVYELYSAAFDSDDEAGAVQILRKNDKSYRAWLVEIEGTVAAHILYTKLSIAGFEHLDKAFGLAPMAVLPRYQNMGIGSILVLESLNSLRLQNVGAVFVLGHKEFYPRFGFNEAIQYGFYYKSAKFSESFFLLELKPNYLHRAHGEVVYNTVFDNL